MSLPQSARTVVRCEEQRRPAAVSVGLRTGLTIYGCTPEEAALFAELAPGFGVTPRIVEPAPTVESAELARGVRCVSVSHRTRISNATLSAFRQAGVRYLSTRSVGYDHIDLEFAAGLGIVVENVAYSPDSVADFTLMLMLMSLRHAKATIRRTDAHDYRLSAVRGRELRDLTVGVVGTGRIGAAVIDRLSGFGCRVLACDLEATTAAEYVDLDELVRRSDIVTLHTPLTSETHHLLDDRRFALMKPGAVLVNTGRGSLVDTDALLRGLEDGRLGGAALDVVEGEEGTFYADRRGTALMDRRLHRLQELPNVILTPHTAYYTDHALRDTVENTLRNCAEFERA